MSAWRTRLTDGTRNALSSVTGQHYGDVLMAAFMTITTRSSSTSWNGYDNPNFNPAGHLAGVRVAGDARERTMTAAKFCFVCVHAKPLSLSFVRCKLTGRGMTNTESCDQFERKEK